MTEADILAKLKDPTRSAAAQSETLSELFAVYERRAAELGGGGELAVSLVKAALRAAASDEAAERALGATLEKVRLHRRAARDAERRELAARVRALAPGTRVVVCDPGGERVAELVVMKRSWFTARFEDGRLNEVPVQLFVRVADDGPCELREGS